MSTEQEYVNYKDFVESLDEATPSADDKAVFNDANGPKGSVFSAIATFVHNTWAAFLNACTAITSFAGGDTFSVSNPTDGTRKMSKDALLKLTAQNAIAGNVAPAFVPSSELNPTTTVAGMPYVYGGKLYVAKENYNGPWDASKFDEICMDKSVISIGAVFDGMFDNDLDNYPPNRIVRCTNNEVGALIAHKPNNRTSFSVLTFGFSPQNTSLLQIFYDNYGSLFYRIKWAEWLDWKEVNAPDIEQNLSSYFSSSATYKLGETICDENGNPIMAKDAISAGTYDATKWFALGNVLNDILFSPKVNSGYAVSAGMFGDDLDNYPTNKILRCANQTVSQGISHKPNNTGEGFIVMTFGVSGSESTKFQIYASESGNYYYRTKWNTWSTWSRVNDPDFGQNLSSYFSSSSTYKLGETICDENGNPIMAKDAIPAGSYDATKWFALGNVLNDMLFSPKVNNGYAVAAGMFGDDLDNYPTNKILRCANQTVSQGISHKPNNTDEGFIVVTFGVSGSESTKLQIYAAANGSIYLRVKWNSWGTWTKLNDFNYVFDNENLSNIFNAFTNLVCIGDSLTRCEVWTSPTTSGLRQAYKTWPQIVARVSGCEQQTLATSGYTAKESWEAYNQDLVQKTNALCIIYLGTNSGLTDTLSTDAPENEPYTNWADTNTGCYAKWVAKAQSLGYKVLLIKPWTTGGDLEVTNNVIDQIASRFSVAKVGPIFNLDRKYHYFPDLSGYNGAHYNDLGYAWFSYALINAASTLPTDIMKLIIPV